MSQLPTFEYSIGDTAAASPASIARDVSEIWKKLQTEGSDERKQALAAGFTADQLDRPQSSALTVTPSGAAVGIDILSVIITLGASGVTKIGTDVWSTIILPLLQRKAGVNVLKPKTPPRPHSSKAKASDDQSGEAKPSANSADDADDEDETTS